MKKFLVLGLTALGLGLVSEQPAQAWINSKFSIGLNWHWQSGGNCLLWGLFCDGHWHGPNYGPFHFEPPLYGVTFPGFQHYGPHDFPYFAQQQAPANSAYAAAPPGTPAPPTAPQQQAAWYGQQNPYQPVNFTPSAYGYPITGYNYPGYFGYAGPPSYWYGR